MQCVVSRKHVADRKLSKPVQKQQSIGFHLVRVAPSEIPSRGHSMHGNTNRKFSWVQIFAIWTQHKCSWVLINVGKPHSPISFAFEILGLSQF